MYIMNQEEADRHEIRNQPDPGHYGETFLVWIDAPPCPKDRSGREYSRKGLFYQIVQPALSAEFEKFTRRQESALGEWFPAHQDLHVQSHRPDTRSTQYCENWLGIVFLVLRLPRSRLLFPQQLEKIGVQPRPGWLYLRVCPPKVKTSEYAPTYLSPKSTECGSIQWGENLLDHPTVPRDRWVIYDLESALGFNQIYNVEIDNDIVVETPLEFAPGFTRQVCLDLKRELGSTCPRLVQSYQEIALGKDSRTGLADIRSPNDDAPQKFRASLAPITQRKLPKSDQLWKSSPRWMDMQLLLLARLIGGASWQSVLANLEVDSGHELDLDQPFI